MHEALRARALALLLLAGLTLPLLPPAPVAGATIIRVPSDYPTIQEAIDAAPNGSVILVEPGVYEECNITVENKSNITIRGYPWATIKCRVEATTGRWSVFYITNSTNVKIENFTFNATVNPNGVASLTLISYHRSRGGEARSILVQEAYAPRGEQLLAIEYSTGSFTLENTTIAQGIILSRLTGVYHSQLDELVVKGVRVNEQVLTFLLVYESSGSITVDDAVLRQCNTLVDAESTNGTIVVNNTRIVSTWSEATYSLFAKNTSALILNDVDLPGGNHFFVSGTRLVKLSQVYYNGSVFIKSNNTIIENSTLGELEVFADNISVSRLQSYPNGDVLLDARRMLVARDLIVESYAWLYGGPDGLLVEGLRCGGLELQGSGRGLARDIRVYATDDDLRVAAKIYNVGRVENVTILGATTYGLDGYNTLVDGIMISLPRVGITGYNLTVRNLTTSNVDYVFAPISKYLGELGTMTSVVVEGFNVSSALLLVDELADENFYSMFVDATFRDGVALADRDVISVRVDDYVDTINVTIENVTIKGVGEWPPAFVYASNLADNGVTMSISARNVRLENVRGFDIYLLEDLLSLQLDLENVTVDGKELIRIIRGVEGVHLDASNVRVVLVRDSRNITITNYVGPENMEWRQIIIINSTNVRLDNVTIGPVHEFWRSYNQLLLQDSRNITITHLTFQDDNAVLKAREVEGLIIILSNLTTNNIWLGEAEDVRLTTPEPVVYEYRGEQYTGILGNHWRDEPELGVPVDGDGDGIAEAYYWVKDRYTLKRYYDHAPLAGDPSEYRILGPATGLPDIEARITYYSPEDALAVVDVRVYNRSMHGERIKVYYNNTLEAWASAYYRRAIPVDLSDYNLTLDQPITLILSCCGRNITLTATPTQPPPEQEPTPPGEETHPENETTTPPPTTTQPPGGETPQQPEQSGQTESPTQAPEGEQTQPPAEAEAPETPQTTPGEKSNHTIIAVAAVIVVALIVAALVLLRR